MKGHLVQRDPVVFDEIQENQKDLLLTIPDLPPLHDHSRTTHYLVLDHSPVTIFDQNPSEFLGCYG